VNRRPTQTGNPQRPARISRESFKHLARGLRYLKHYRGVTTIAYAALFVSSAAQLAVPRLVRSIIDSVTNGVTANRILDMPAQAQTSIAAQRGMTLDQIRLDASGAENAILAAGIAIVVFALARGLFSFVQGYMAERLSQNIAFDIRNELFAKIQRLSFSYHDRNQTGQLMIRATDDVEKVRLFIGQGLILALQALVLLVGTLIILVTTNVKLTLVALCRSFRCRWSSSCFSARSLNPCSGSCKNGFRCSTPFCRKIWPVFASSKPLPARPRNRNAFELRRTVCFNRT
jgi:ATP-binding cassette subfamily B protein